MVVAVLAIPVFSIQLGHIGDGADPTRFTDRRAYDLMTDAFGPGSNGPLTVVVDQTQRSRPTALRPRLDQAQKALTRRTGRGHRHPADRRPGTATSLIGTVYSERRAAGRRRPPT